MEPSAAEASASRPVYSIGAVARMLGAEPATLRAWEERYRVIVPARSQGSHRLYSRDQVEQLRFVLRAMENGSSAADAHRLLAEQLGLPSDVTVAERDVVMLILLADRDRFAAELCKYFLRTEGYEVCLAANTADAERRFVERQPALSVVELVMPGGLGLCRPPWTVRDLSTVSEPLDKLLRYGESLRFFDAEKVGRSVFYDDLGSVLNDGGLSAVLERIDLLVKEHRPSVVVIDSFKALKAFADGEAPFRRFLHELAGGRPHRRILLQPHGLHRGGRLRADRDRALRVEAWGCVCRSLSD